MRPKIRRPMIEWSNYRLGRDDDEVIAARVRADYPEHEGVTAETVRGARARLGIRSNTATKMRGA